MDELELLQGDTISYDNSFTVAIECSKLLNSADVESQNKARKIIIFALDRINDIPSTTYPIWTDLIESAGFYPYLNTDKTQLETLSDQIRAHYFDSKYLADKVLHQEQK